MQMRRATILLIAGWLGILGFPLTLSAQQGTLLGSGTAVASVTAPDTPNGPTPADASSSIATNVTLTWAARGATSYDIYFGTAVSPPLVASAQTTPSYAPGALIIVTTYYWKIVARNAAGTATGPVWSFTTINPLPAPGTPASPNPADVANNTTVGPTLTWVSTSATSYDVYFGTASNPPLVTTGQSAASYTPSALIVITTYYWKIVAHNITGNTTGPIWSFTTAGPPGVPTLTSPANAATNVSANPTFTWTAGTGLTSNYDVMLGTACNQQQLVSSAQTTTSYISATNANTAYCWSVIARNGFGTTTTGNFTFTTAIGAPGVPSVIAPSNGATNLGTAPTITWTAVNGTTCDVYLDTSNPPTTAKSLAQSCDTYTVSPALSNSTVYYIKIVATNVSGSTQNCGPSANCPSFTTTAGGAPVTGGGGNLATMASNATYLGSFKQPAGGASGASGTYKSWNADYSVSNASYFTGNMLNFQTRGGANGLAVVTPLVNVKGASLTSQLTTASLYVPGNSGQTNGVFPMVDQGVCEISIPQSPSTSANTAVWPTATLLTNCYQVSEGHGADIQTTCVGTPLIMGGFAQVGTNLVFTQQCYYDGGSNQVKAVFTRPINLSTTGSVSGPFLLNFPISGATTTARFENGHVGMIPLAWRCGLMGLPGTSSPCTDASTTVPNDIFIGTNSTNIIAGTSAGPVALGFLSSSIGATYDCVGAHRCGTGNMYYPNGHTIPGGTSFNPCASNPGTNPNGYAYIGFTNAQVNGVTADGNCPGPVNTVFNGGQTILAGCQVWPGGSRTLMCISVEGGGTQAAQNVFATWTGGACYGSGTPTNPVSSGYGVLPWTCGGMPASSPNLAACGGASSRKCPISLFPTPPSDCGTEVFSYCVDTTGNTNRGNHAAPYEVHAHGFDLTKLMNVIVNGTAPWLTAMDSNETITLPSAEVNNRVIGTAIDTVAGCHGITGASGYAGCLFILAEQGNGGSQSFVHVYGLSVP